MGQSSSKPIKGVAEKSSTESNDIPNEAAEKSSTESNDVPKEAAEESSTVSGAASNEKEGAIPANMESLNQSIENVPPIPNFLRVDQIAKLPNDVVQNLAQLREETSNIVSAKDDEISKLKGAIQLLENERVKANTENRTVRSRISQLAYENYFLKKDVEGRNAEILQLNQQNNAKITQLEYHSRAKDEEIRRAELELHNARMYAVDQQKLMKRAEESQKKERELKNLVESLKNDLKKTRDDFIEIKTKLNNSGRKYQAEIRTRDEEISKLKRKLENATNTTVDSFQCSRGRVASVQKSMQMKPIENAPINAKQMMTRNDPRALTVSAHGNASRSEEEGANEKLEKTKRELEQAVKSVEQLQTDNNELRIQRHDLAMQIHALLKETGKYAEASNFAFSTSGFQTGLKIDSPAQKKVTENLVQFRNVEQLQNQNQRLLTTVRNLTERHDKLTREVENREWQLVKVTDEDIERLTETAKKYEELKAAYHLLQNEHENCKREREKQEKGIETQPQAKEATQEKHPEEEVHCLKSAVAVTHLSKEIKLLQRQLQNLSEDSLKRSDFPRKATKRSNDFFQHLLEQYYEEGEEQAKLENGPVAKRSKITEAGVETQINNNGLAASSNNVAAAAPLPFKLKFTLQGTECINL